jgi:predicted ATPase
LKIVEEGLSRLRQPFQPFTQVYALNLAVQLHQFRREAGAVVEQAGALVAQAAESGFDLYWAIGTILKGWGTARQGQAAQGIAQMQEGLAQFDALGASWAQPYFLALLAEAYQEGGRIGDALNSAGQALIRVEKTAERWYEPELLRLQGDLLLARGTAGVQAEVEAESRFRQALAIARQQDAKSLELRAAVSLGCLWRRQGRRQEARELLAAIHGWFSEGFATPDLQAARQLLDELSHPSDFGRVTTNV